MRATFFVVLFSAGASVMTAGTVQPDFVLPDVNPGSVRNAGQSVTQSVSPRHYRQQIAAYYFSQEW